MVINQTLSYYGSLKICISNIIITVWILFIVIVHIWLSQNALVQYIKNLYFSERMVWLSYLYVKGSTSLSTIFGTFFSSKMAKDIWYLYIKSRSV